MSLIALKSNGLEQWQRVAEAAGNRMETRLFIDGDYVDAQAGGRFNSVNPATGETVALRKDAIDDRAKGKSAMPEDLMKHLSKRELRDLVEFLSSLKKRAKR